MVMMSEKRFFVKKIEDDFCILDSFNDKNVVIYCDSERVIQECCDLLNELNEENTELKKENDNCKNDYRELFSDYISLEEKNKELEKENEQLQKETFFLAYWKRKAMILLMQVRRLTPRMTDKEVREFAKELEEDE